MAGLILLLIPRGSPWAALTFFSPAVLGRAVPPAGTMPLPVVWAIHLAISVAYGLVVALVVARLREAQAIIAGGITGLVLYVINYAVVAAALPHWLGNELPVLFTHVVFGLIAGGAYRGLLKRQPATEIPGGLSP
jgi:ABC-type glucose/galactose transport system permease subunit